MNSFWLVWNYNGGAPTVPHGSYESAHAEAERLARCNKGQKFVVMQSVTACIVDDMKIIDLRPDSQYEDGIPF